MGRRRACTGDFPVGMGKGGWAHERSKEPFLMLNSFIRLVGGDPNRRDIEHYIDRVDQINGLEARYQALDDESLRAVSDAPAFGKARRLRISSRRRLRPSARPPAARSACGTTTSS
jgi:hypothetical protein